MSTPSPHVFGLTGGIACGKSTVTQLLQERGWAVIDSDQLAHQLMEPGAENWQKIVDAFGAELLNSDQTINRGALGDLIFREPRLREKLNSLTHPAIRKAWQKERESFLENLPVVQKSQPKLPSKLVITIPLLFETGLEHEFKTILCVGCSAGLQRARLLGRGLTPEKIDLRLQSQLPLEEKIKRSHHLIWNEGTLAALSLQLDQLGLI